MKGKNERYLSSSELLTFFSKDPSFLVGFSTIGGGGSARIESEGGGGSARMEPALLSASGGPGSPMKEPELASQAPAMARVYSSGKRGSLMRFGRRRHSKRTGHE